MQGGEGMAPLTEKQQDLAVRRRNGSSLRLIQRRHEDNDESLEVVPNSVDSPTSPAGPSSPASPTSPTSLIPAIVPTSTTSTISPTPSGSNNNGAQISSVPLVVSETIPPPPPPPPQTTTTTSISTAPNSVITSFIPLLTTSEQSTPLGSASTCLTTSSSISTTVVAAAASVSIFSSTSSLSSTLTPTSVTSFSSTLSVSATTTSAAKKHKATDDSDDNSTSGVITGSTNEKGNSGSIDGNDGDDDDGGSYKHSSSKGKPLSPEAEHALISIGSIGAFITVCFLVWLVWRTMGKQKRRKMTHQMGDGGDPSSAAAGIGGLPRRLYATVASRVPFLQRRQRPWHTLDGASEAGIPIDSRSLGRANSLNQRPLPEMYHDKKYAGSPPVLPVEMYYDNGLGLSLPPHLLQQIQQQQQQQLQQQYTYRSVSSNSGSSVYTHQPSESLSSMGTAPIYAAASVPTNMPVAELAGSEGPPLPTLPTYAASVSAPIISGSASVLSAEAPVSSLSGTLRSTPGTISDFVSADDGSSAVGSDTLRSRMPDSYYNQSQLARQPSDAYDPARREVNRVSELSSLSSGFGDGEIMMPLPRLPGASLGLTSETFTIPPPAIPPPAATGPGRFSWMRSSRRFTSSTRRETVFTEASEDQPARFRTVTSWVHQQTGRVRRAQQGSETATRTTASSDTAPGIAHPMPAEPRLTMMADDGQEPRRPETVPALQMTGTSS